MLARYVWADLLRNPRRTLSTVAGVFLGVGLACAILFFVDGLSASMTQQAVAPLPIDMQQVLSAPPAGNILFTLSLEPAGAVAPGDIVHVRLELVNQGQTPVNELVVRAIPDDALVYIPGSATRDGSLLANALENPFAAGPAKAGLNIGTLAAGTTVILEYDLEAIAATAAIAQPIAATYSSREAVTPVVANAAAPLNPAELAARLRAIEGIAFAEQLAFVDLPAGALAASRPTDSLVRVFGFDQSYTSHDRSILINEGGQTAGAAMLSAEAAAYLGVSVGDTVTLALPDGASLELAVSGIVDLTQARSLFSSRRGADFETFIYIPNAIIVDSALFAEVVVPAFERVAADRGERVKNPPIHEIALGVDRERLDAEPAVALRQTEQIAAQVAATAGEQGYLLDNISNALTVARADANLAKRMFAFLGVPGAILAATLAAYAGIVLAGAQRREQAILRIRGANRRHLLAMLALRVGTITLTGAIIGVVLGYSTAVSVVGSAALGRAALTSLATSAVLGTLAGLLATGGALYVTGRRSIDHEINEEKARLWSEPPAWWQYRLDLAGLLLLAIATGSAAAMGGFAGMPGSVYVGRPVDLPIELLILPIAAWMAGALLGGRGLAAILRRGQAHRSTIGVRPLQFLYQRSIRRRVWVLVDVAVILGMVIALGTSLAIFAASYDGAKIADARFIVGSDLKIWPSPGNERLYGSADADAFMVPGVKRVTPVIFGVHNVILRSNRTSEVANLAAVDADTYAQIAPLQDAHFPDSGAASELSQLAGQPDALLLSVEMADFLQAEVGDTVRVLLARGSSEQVEIELVLTGVFERLPGFPDGADALMNLARHEEMVPTTGPAFFLAQLSDPTDAALQMTVAHLRSAQSSGDTLQIETRLSALAQDQSSLAALNIAGLLKLDSGYSLAMGAVTVGLFVFGLLLQRRREYVTLRAQGMAPAAIRTLIAAETLTAAAAGCVVGVLVGCGMSYYLVRVLRPLFILEPQLQLPGRSLLLIVGSVLVAALVTVIMASSLVNRLRATELLRDE